MEYILTTISGIAVGVVLGYISRRTKKQKEKDETILTCLWALLACHKNGKANGEVDKAWEMLKKYIIVN